MSKELKEKTEKELKKMLADNPEELRKTRFSLSHSAKRNSKNENAMKKMNARILTELNTRLTK